MLTPRSGRFALLAIAGASAPPAQAVFYGGILVIVGLLVTALPLVVKNIGPQGAGGCGLRAVARFAEFLGEPSMASRHGAAPRAALVAGLLRPEVSSFRRRVPRILSSAGEINYR